MDRLTGRSQKVAAKVRAVVEASGLSDRYVSEVTGIPRETLRRRMAGQSPFTIDDLDSISLKLGVDFYELIDHPRRLAS